MSTNSSISIKKDNKYKSVYCHWDGYLQYNGVILYEKYNTLEKIEELFSYGDISSLGETIETCKFYHRDRNEKLSLPSWDSNLLYEEYTYVFEDDTWYVYDYYYYYEDDTKEIHYDKISLLEALSLEIKDYKQKIRIEKIKRLNDNSL